MSKKLSVESTGASLEAAIQAGLAELGVERTNVKMDVLEEGSPGILGIGQKNAHVRLTVLNEDQVEEEEVIESDADDSVDSAEPTTAPPAAKQDEPAASNDDDNEAADTDDSDAVVHPTLAQEVEVSGHVVSTLLEMMGIEADVDVIVSEIDDFGEQIPVVKVVGDDLKILIGHRGKVLNDFQFLARSMASQKLEGRTTFVVDVDGYREKRTDTLVELAQRTADKVVKFRRPVALNPMPPHERRVIHMALRNDDRVSTSSKGEGKRRRVRVVPTR